MIQAKKGHNDGTVRVIKSQSIVTFSIYEMRLGSVLENLSNMSLKIANLLQTLLHFCLIKCACWKVLEYASQRILVSFAVYPGGNLS